METHGFGLRSPTMARVSARLCYREYLIRSSQPKVRQGMAWACGSASKSSKSTAAPSVYDRAQAIRTEQPFPLSCQSLPLDPISNCHNPPERKKRSSVLKECQIADALINTGLVPISSRNESYFSPETQQNLLSSLLNQITSSIYELRSSYAHFDRIEVDPKPLNAERSGSFSRCI